MQPLNPDEVGLLDFSKLKFLEAITLITDFEPVLDENDTQAKKAFLDDSMVWIFDTITHNPDGNSIKNEQFIIAMPMEAMLYMIARTVKHRKDAAAESGLILPNNLPPTTPPGSPT